MFIVSEVGAYIPISLQNASCSILDLQTVRFRNFYAQGSGQFSLCKLYFATTGNHRVSAYVTDSAGNKSNTLTTYVSVTSSSTGGHCYVGPYTLAVCCDYYGNGNYICDYTNTCGQLGGICINNKEATDIDEVMKKPF